MNTDRRPVRGPGFCPCPYPDCRVPALKAGPTGHAIGCTGGCCANARRGKATEIRRHRRLTSARAPVDESAYGYPIRVSTQDKTGKQIPALFWQTMEGAFFRKAMKQAHDKIPVGSVTIPGVYVEHADGRAYLVLDMTGRQFDGRSDGT